MGIRGADVGHGLASFADAFVRGMIGAHQRAQASKERKARGAQQEARHQEMMGLQRQRFDFAKQQAQTRGDLATATAAATAAHRKKQLEMEGRRISAQNRRARLDRESREKMGMLGIAERAGRQRDPYQEAWAREEAKLERLRRQRLGELQWQSEQQGDVGPPSPQFEGIASIPPPSGRRDPLTEDLARLNIATTGSAVRAAETLSRRRREEQKGQLQAKALRGDQEAQMDLAFLLFQEQYARANNMTVGDLESAAQDPAFAQKLVQEFERSMQR